MAAGRSAVHAWEYRWCVPGMPMTPAWFDRRCKGWAFSTLRRIGIIALIEPERTTTITITPQLGEYLDVFTQRNQEKK